jgi:hypothetical protein
MFSSYTTEVCSPHTLQERNLCHPFLGINAINTIRRSSVCRIQTYGVADHPDGLTGRYHRSLGQHRILKIKHIELWFQQPTASTEILRHQ